MKFKLKLKYYPYPENYYDCGITLKYLNIFSPLGFRSKLYEKLNNKAFPKINLSLRVETDDEDVITSAKIVWYFNTDEFIFGGEDEIFFYNRDKSQGRIDSHITEAVDEYFNSLGLNDLLQKLLNEVCRLKDLIEVVE